MSHEHPITTVIVTYNSRDTLADTLPAARRCHEAGLGGCVVVDNRSRDGTPAFVAAEHPWVRLVESPTNLGFGRGNNRGFEEVTTPYVLFLNPDAVMEPAALRTLLDFMERHPRCGVAAPAARMPGGHHHLHGQLPTPARVLLDSALPEVSRRMMSPLVPGGPSFEVEWVPGAAMLWRTELFRALGGFDPRFFLYFEETDLLLRARQSGAELWAVCEAVIDHVGGASTRKAGESMFHGCIAEHYFQSRFYYLRKHHGLPGALAAEVGELASLVARSVPQVLRGDRMPVIRHRLRGPLFSSPPPRA